MNCTRRIIKFMLVAAIALPAWHASVAQNRAVPPEEAPTENQVREKANDLKGLSVATRNAESRPVGKSVSIDASNASTSTGFLSSDVVGKKPANPMCISTPVKGKNKGLRVNRASKAPTKAGTVVTLPSTATVETWNITTEWYKASSSGGFDQQDFATTVQVAFDSNSNDVYIAGLCNVFPDAWVKGTLSGNTVKFATEQYFGTYTNDGTNYEFWFVAENADDQEVDYAEFSYDASQHKLVLQTAYVSIMSAPDDDERGYYSYHMNTVIEKPTAVTVADGTATGKVPVYLNYLDYYNHGQAIYPANMLNLETGAKIKSITFYANGALSGTNNSGYDNSVTIKIGETQNTTYSSTAFISSNLTTVATMSNILTGDASVTFTFNEPYEYKGGNLVIDATTPDWSYNTYNGSYSYKYTSSSVTWLGQSSSGSSLLYYKATSSGNSSTAAGTQQNFLPKMYIVYELPEPYAATLTGDGAFGHVQIGETATSTFVVTNEGANAFTPVVTATGNGFTVTSTGSGQLASGATRNYTVTFAPTAAQDYAGTLTLTAQESEASAISASIGLSGTGVNEKTVTVADGTATGKLPVYLHYLDADNHGQMIYPADILDLTPGSLIKSISFYTNNNLTNYSSSSVNVNTVTLKLGETSQSTYSSVNFLTGLTTVATLTTTKMLNGTTMATFTFNTPYEYQGGNLVVDATCPALDGGQYPSSSVQWLGKEVTGAGVLYMYYSSTSSNNVNAVQNFMPKMTMVVEMAAATQTTELDFGSVDVERSKTLSAYIASGSDSPVTATLTVASNPTFSVASTTVTLEPNGTTPVPVTFTPSEARSYTGTLTVVAGDVTTTISLKGVGNMSGPEAVRDSAFYAGISYKWPINVTNPTDTSRLDEVATDPDQMIALIREVYTNKSIPGNFKRGYANTGGTSYFGTHDNNVQYTGAGLIERDGSYVSFSDAYGWDIPSDSLIIGSSNSISYAYMNPYQYKPDNEGVTLLLLEMVDDFDPNNVTVSATGYAGLKELFSKTLKSVRVITQAKRTGEGESRGTLFNIDCDKMNKFYLLAKGQLGWLRSAWFNHQSSTFTSFYTEPCYIYSSSYDEYADPALEKFFFLGHMFEQFSPASPNATATELDLYRKMTTGDSFPVVHDCPNVPYIESGHHFMMYGTESGAADCQDVRDLMFFVPDYRMMDHADRGSKSSSSSLIFQDYFEYHPNHQPTMGLYVIIQDSVEAVTRADSYFKLKLTWDSNMDEFMPGDQQEYQLYQVVTDEFGVSKWVPVYKRNAQGQYWSPTTNAWQADTTGAERVVLTMNPSADKKTYAEVYEMRENSGRIVTYAVRGQDTGHFLSLQMSNEESYFIPGKDPAEMALMSSATVYSRYEAQNENNCYSNKLLLKSSPRTIKASYLPDGSTMTINRTHRVMENNQSVEVTVPIATLKVTNSGSNKYFTVEGPVLDGSVKNLFPKGTEDNLTAGYHANTLTNGNQIAYTTETVGGTEYMNFNIALWDNFVADVSKNEHPGLYTYQLVFNTAEPFTGLNGSTNEAYSNIIPVFVYKTDSRINEPLTLAQVQADVDCNPDYEPGDVEFSAQVQLSSKSEILRYDAYRWNEGAERSIVDYGGETDEDEEDYDPNGIAGNQGDSYSVTMNAIGTDDYYVGNAVPVTDAAPQNWAKFVDYYPAKQPNGGAFTYAPVVELFTRGYVEGSTTKERGDYNTYGGPLKTTAVGKIELEIPKNPNNEGNPFMSSYKWKDGNDWCAYYNIPVKFKVLGIPEGYELYKIRAWRDVDTKILREELTSRQDRIASNYLFEDLTYGDALEATGSSDMKLCKADVFNEESNYSYEVGCRPIHDADPEYNIQGETHATFGALRLNTKDDQPYSINELNATIKVRAYFTKTSNPIFSNPIYVIADNGTGWAFSEPVGTLRYDGTNFTGTVTIPEGSDGSGKGYFMFSKQLGSSWTNNPKYIFGPESNGNAVVSENPSDEGYNLKYWQGGTKVFEVYPGTYTLSIGSHVQTWGESVQYDYQAGYLKISKAAAKAPTRDLTPAEFDYYVAEGEVEFTSSDYNIITGISDLNMDGNREVMSVSYVNTIGQASSKPWQGINIVVTRYSDGSVVTRKEVK